MQGHLHVCLLRHWNDPFEKVGEIIPDSVLADPAPLGESLLFRDLIVELAGQGASSFGEIDPGAIPPNPGHKVVAAHGDPDFAQGLDHGTVVGDLLIPARQSQLDLFGRDRMAFHPGDRKPGRLVGRFDLHQRIEVLLPRDLAQHVTQRDDRVIDADLMRQYPVLGILRAEHQRQLHTRICRTGPARSRSIGRWKPLPRRLRDGGQHGRPAQKAGHDGLAKSSSVRLQWHSFRLFVWLAVGHGFAPSCSVRLQ